MSESTAEKSLRYLVEGRLIVSAITDGQIIATCRGTGAVHNLSWTRGGGWYCSCPARNLCSHLLALQTVTARPKAAQP
jgi:SWIM zinc finger